MYKFLKKRKGITLISLVVTIIVLLILVAVSIAKLTGENGILTQAQNAKEETTKAEEEEKIKMAVMGSSISDDGFVEMIDETSFKNELKNQFGNQKLDVVVNGDGSFLITVEDTQRKYYVNDDKRVINSDNIIEISTAEELESFRDDVNNGNTYEDWYVYLANDITLDMNEEWEPIGNAEYLFKGIFNGEKNEVHGIYINTNENNQALFGYADNANIINLGIGQDCNITGGNFTAGIIGTAYNGTQIINCFNKSPITCSGIASGGIAGQFSINGLIRQCYNTGNVNSSGTHVGGICGNLDKNSIIDECYNSSAITGPSTYIGGILGVLQNGCILQNCYNTGIILGHTSVGGICGEAMGSEAYVKNCYNIGSITASKQVSGIVYCWNNSNALNCLYLENTVNNSNDTILNEGIVSMSSEKIKHSFNLLGKAFKEDIEGINNGYPILEWQ